VGALAAEFGMEEEAKVLLEPVSLRHGRDVAQLFELERLAAFLAKLVEAADVPVAEATAEAADLNDAISRALADAEIDSPEKLQRATDEELLAIKGIGPKSLAEIREVYPHNPNAGLEPGEQIDGEQGERPEGSEPGTQEPGGELPPAVVDGAGQPVVEGVSVESVMSPVERQEAELAASDDTRPRPTAPPLDDARMPD
jgi:hypothetical protein